MSHRDYAVTMISAPNPGHNNPERIKKQQVKPPFPAENDDSIKINSLNDQKPDNITNRRRLVADSIVGFIGFFAGIAFLEAVANVFRPEPAITPAVVMLVLVIATVAALRWRRSLK